MASEARAASLNRAVPLMRKFDPHVFFTLVLRSWTIVAGGVTLLLIPRVLTAVEQGYYFTFASILAMQIFFELGFNNVLVQFTAAEMADIRWHRRDLLAGSARALARLGSLVRLSRRAYIGLSCLYFGVVSVAGIAFFHGAHEPAPRWWAISWILMVTFASGNLLFSPRLAIVEGTGRVGAIARLRTLQSVVGYGGAWIAFSLGAGLLALPIISGAAFVGNCIWFRSEGRFLVALERHARRGTSVARIDWRREIFPFQWRIALSWISGYLIFQLFNPILFRTYGAQEAGRVGFMLAIFTSLSTLSMSWVNAKAPEMSRLLSAGRTDEARSLFWRQARSASLLLLFLCVTALAASAFVLPLFPSVRARLPSEGVIFWVAIAAVSNQSVFSMAVFMRAHGKEVLVWPSVVTGLATVAVMSIATRFSVEMTMASYAAVQVGLCLPWVAFIFFSRFWKR